MQISDTFRIIRGLDIIISTKALCLPLFISCFLSPSLSLPLLFVLSLVYFSVYMKHFFFSLSCAPFFSLMLWLFLCGKSFWHEINVSNAKTLITEFFFFYLSDAQPQIIGFWCMPPFFSLSLIYVCFAIFPAARSFNKKEKEKKSIWFHSFMHAYEWM